MSEKQLAAARALAAHAAQALKADLSVELWNGEILPLGPGARQDIRIRIGSPDAVRRMLFSPRLMTVYELYSTGDIDVVGGSPMEAARRWDHITALKAAKELDKGLVVRSLLPFLFSRGGTARLTAREAFDDGRVARKPEQGRDDKELIQFHYDVSNAFYALFLDPEMVYSSAYFEDDDTTLAEAQVAKLEMICRRLRLKPGEHMLDIGCGWGSLICHAVRNHGVTVHGVTLSQKQFDYITEKIGRLGIAERVTLELKDYRAIEGAEVYDKIAQIEMFEHLGIDNHDRHFTHVHRLLKKRGLYLHQASTRRATRNLKDFRKVTPYMEIIRRFIFPGGELDYIGMTVTNLERLGFEVHDVENWREHFEKTTRIWAENLYARREEGVAEIGLNRTRLWLLYLTMVALAFERGTIYVFQTLASKRHTGRSGLPWTRRDLYR